MTYQAPKCSDCGASLDRVSETEYNTYRFNPETGCYDVDGTILVTCPYCDADLRDTPEFESGACNYHVYRQEEEARQDNV